MALPLITIVAAARPNFMKVAPLIHAFQDESNLFRTHLVHTGQHYDDAMNDAFFKQLNIPAPFCNLGIGSGSHAVQTGKTMIAFETYLEEHKPNLVIVVGDVNATLACSLAATKCHIKVAHVEAGLRSDDRHMPEEINRILTDQIADLLFTPSPDADANLSKEGIPGHKIICVGNIMIDSLIKQLPKAKSGNYVGTLGLSNQDYFVLTLHRPSNVDNQATLASLVHTFQSISKDTTLIFPCHPRTLTQLKKVDLIKHLSCDTIEPKQINLIPPIGYHEMLQLIVNSKGVLTDSGGLQEETTALGIPCLTLRETTERPITVSEGTNQVVGRDHDTILNGIKIMSETSGKCPDLWDGKTAERIVSHLKTLSL